MRSKLCEWLTCSAMRFRGKRSPSNNMKLLVADVPDNRAWQLEIGLGIDLRNRLGVDRLGSHQTQKLAELRQATNVFSSDTCSALSCMLALPAR